MGQPACPLMSSPVAGLPPPCLAMYVCDPLHVTHWQSWQDPVCHLATVLLLSYDGALLPAASGDLQVIKEQIGVRQYRGRSLRSR